MSWNDDDLKFREVPDLQSPALTPVLRHFCLERRAEWRFALFFAPEISTVYF